MINQDKSDFVQRLKSIIDTAIDGIITIDHKGIIESMNPSASILFGYEASEILGKNVNVLMPDPYKNDHDGYIERYQKTRKAHIIGIGREVMGKKSNGEIFPMRLAVSEVVLNDRVIYTGIIHDLSIVKKAQAEIEELNKELESKVEKRTQDLNLAVKELQSATEKLKISEKDLKLALETEKELNELKSRFVSMASHEFRTPLTTIMSSASLITKYPETDQQEHREKHVDRIKSAVVNLTGILNDFLSLSMLEEGAVNVNIDEVDVQELLKEVVNELKGMNKNNQSIVFDVRVPKVIIPTDRRILKNILFNLLSNAIKYSELEILVKYDIVDGQVVLSISDQGIGVPEKDQKYLFTRFFRASNALNTQGTGLGLNIVRRYVSLLKGSITYISTEDSGTTFTVIFPLKYTH